MNRFQFDEKTRATLESLRTPLGVYQFINKRVVTLVLSAGFCELFGFASRQEAYDLMDRDMYQKTHPDDAARVADAAFRFATVGGRYEVIYRTMTRYSAKYRIIHAMGEHVYTEDGVRLAYVWYTDEGAYSGGAQQSASLNAALNQALHQESILQASYFDFLTGLPSMAYFFDLAKEGRIEIQKQGGKPALLYFDMNGMKYFNRKFGFAEGDKLLRSFAGVLKKHFSNENCGRLGSDHFAVFTDVQGAEARIKQIFAECGKINENKSLPIRVGIYQDGDELVDISTACDRAKYACDALRNTYVSSFNYFNQSMLEDVERRRYIIDNLDRALAEEWIQVYYQPIVRAANGKICDEEALARWVDPVKGFLSPADFIPILEDAKLIYRLDLYMADHVLEKMKQQERAGLPVVPESINLSRADFDTCDIVEEIRKRVDAAGVDREKLNIEVTESVVGSDFEFMKEQIERFQKLGFKVWMDDFGSGYSSLDVLQRTRFDLIKFDMRFMQQFDQSDKSKIILTELIKMALGLGIDTICEGVETREQAEFLREVGCTKLQGFYFSNALPQREIVERTRKGTHIGFENPRETAYYAAIGKINLYDLSIVFNEDEKDLRHYFNTLPMAVYESTGEEYMLVRCNNTYRDFREKLFADARAGSWYPYAQEEGRKGAEGFLKALRECGERGEKLLLDEELADGATAHSILKRIAVNPVTGTKAVAAAILAVTDEKKLTSGFTFTHIAKALSSDYINLYDVDLDTDQYIEYSSAAAQAELSVERHGENFFAASQSDAAIFIYSEDQPAFLNAFVKENIIKAIDGHGAFTLTYRLLIDGRPTYVNLKAVRMPAEGNHIIIGVNNVDVQMRQKEALERAKEERITYARISALSGDYICIYTVDPVTERYTQYSATEDYEGLGLPRTGGAFFETVREEAGRTVYDEDVDKVRAALTKENVLREIRRNGLFALNYRLMLGSGPKYVSLKAAIVEEKDGPQIILGVTNIDAQVRRELDYEYKLSVARRRANLDPLTGVKNEHAYREAEGILDRQISQGVPVRFATVVCEVTGLNADPDPGEDIAIKAACSTVCNVFKHSPVFRLSGKAFAVIAQGHDYDCIEGLTKELEVLNGRNREEGNTVLAFGMAKYGSDKSASKVFDRASQAMYQNRSASNG